MNGFVRNFLQLDDGSSAIPAIGGNEELALGIIDTVAQRVGAESADGASTIPNGTIADVEWRMIQDALRRHGRNKTAAARALGISLRTLYNKLEAREQDGRASTEGGQSISTPT